MGVICILKNWIEFGVDTPQEIAFEDHLFLDVTSAGAPKLTSKPIRLIAGSQLQRFSDGSFVVLRPKTIVSGPLPRPPTLHW